MRSCHLILVLLTALVAQEPRATVDQHAFDSVGTETSLRSFLKSFLAEHHDRDNTVKFQYALFDLNDDGRDEVIVYLEAQGWCGSGGCNTFVLTREENSYRIVTRITITRPPIRVLNRKSNGWHNLAVWREGGNSDPGYEAELPFDGRSYASNPSMPPARPATKSLSGKTIIAVDWVGKRLYP